MPLLAHTGHWAIYVLYAIPVVIVVTSIVLSILRQRREGARGEGRPGPDPPPHEDQPVHPESPQ